jgi:hypothetical protein
MAPSEDPPDSTHGRRGRVEIQFGSPLKFIEAPPTADADSSETEAAEGRSAARTVGATIKAYRQAAKQLLDGRYADIRSYAPSHLREPSSTTVLCCEDGIIVRYDAAEVDEPKVRSGSLGVGLAEAAPQFSDSLIHFPSDPGQYDPGPGGIEIHFAKFSLSSGEQKPIGAMRPLIYATSRGPAVEATMPPPLRPRPLISVGNELEIVISGVVEPAEGPSSPQLISKSQEFVARGTMALQVGLRAIEIYPCFDSAYWQPQYAALWAEADLLAAVARSQLRDAHFNALDPNLAARKAFADLLAGLQELLDGPEEPAHQFLKANPALLSPTHIASWSKLPFGDRVSDFVFREPGGDYLLVEIESPVRELFRKDGQQRQELTHAINQILDWRVFLENNLNAVREDLGLSGISANPRSLIVIGRSSSLSEANRLKLTTLQNQTPNLKIITYDDLIASAKAVVENLFGPLDLMLSNGDIYFLPSRVPNQAG